MLESPTPAPSAPAPTTVVADPTTAQHQQMARKIENGDFAEDYFGSLTGPAKRLIEDVVAVKEAYEDVWTGLDVSEQEQIINESIIRPDAILRYEGHVAIRDSARHPSANTAEVRLSSFGVDKVFPRFKVQSGQKENTFEDTSGSQGEDLGSDCTYSYRDEHSAPWSWMTRSQQELSFESGPTEQCSSEDLDGLETLTTASPSRACNRQSLLVRHSKGNPLYAKPVGIPIVPMLQAKLNPDQLIKMEQSQAPPISPHKINNFVYEEDNRIILDFGTNNDFGTTHGTSIDNALRGSGGHSPTSNSESLSKSSSSLLAKMKEKKNTLKKSLSNVSNGGTLRRKKSQKLLNNISPSSTLSSTNSSMSSLPITSKSIVKPSSAPPPPPIPISRPVFSINNSQMTQSLYETKSVSDQNGTNCVQYGTNASKNDTIDDGTKDYINCPSNGTNGTNGSKNDTSGTHHQQSGGQSQTQQNQDDIVKPLEEFKIDLDTQSDVPKSGFDFLDDW